MTDEIKRQINDLKNQINDLKREVGKAIDMLHDTNSRLKRLEEESKIGLKNIRSSLEDIKGKINQ